MGGWASPSDAVQEGVQGGRAALFPLGEAVAARGAVTGRNLDGAGRAALYDRCIDAASFKRPVHEIGGDRRAV